MGGHNVTIRNNVVKNNNTVGVGVVENPFGFGSSNNTTVTGNMIKKNGESPDPRTKGLRRHRLPGRPRKRKLHLGERLHDVVLPVRRTAGLQLSDPPGCPVDTLARSARRPSASKLASAAGSPTRATSWLSLTHKEYAADGPMRHRADEAGRINRGGRRTERPRACRAPAPPRHRAGRAPRCRSLRIPRNSRRFPRTSALRRSPPRCPRQRCLRTRSWLRTAEAICTTTPT